MSQIYPNVKTAFRPSFAAGNLEPWVDRLVDYEFKRNVPILSSVLQSKRDLSVGISTSLGEIALQRRLVCRGS
jgi:hypothetical protein